MHSESPLDSRQSNQSELGNSSQEPFTSTDNFPSVDERAFSCQNWKLQTSKSNNLKQHQYCKQFVFDRLDSQFSLPVVESQVLFDSSILRILGLPNRKHEGVPFSATWMCDRCRCCNGPAAFRATAGSPRDFLRCQAPGLRPPLRHPPRRFHQSSFSR